MTATNVQPLQWVSLIIAVLILLLQIEQWIKTPEKRLWLIPIVAWMLHAMVFYVVLFIERIGVISTGIMYTDWSGVLRLHGFLTILSLEGARVYLHLACRRPKE